MAAHAPRLLVLAAVLGLTGLLTACDKGKPEPVANPAAGHDGHDHDHAADGHSHDHAHADIPTPADYAQLVTMIRQHAEAIEKKLAAGKLEGLHDDAHVIAELAGTAGKLALADPSIPRDKVRDANVSGKELAQAADALDALADAGKLEECRKGFAALQPLIGKVAAVAPEQWVCEMHCEPGKVYDKPGKCPVCRMALSRKGDIPYSAVVTALSPTLEPGKPVNLKIELLDPVGMPVQKLDVVHEQILHMLTVSNDLSWYSHEHPVRQPDGSFKVTLTFPNPGDYTVFADFTPTGAGQQAPSAALAIAGTPPAPVPLVEDTDQVKQIDGYTVRVRCNGGSLYAGRDSLLRFGISIGSDPVTDLEPYLGALGHLVIISQDLKSFVHSHPLNDDVKKDDGHEHAHDHSSAGGHDHGGASPEELMAEAAKLGNGTPNDPVFHVVFPRPGLYKAFAQFQHKGKVITVPFTLNVKADEGSTPILGPGGHDHDHDHGDHK
jgi:HPt (histidine-containing phosphotransfer) domain-containing protein